MAGGAEEALSGATALAAAIDASPESSPQSAASPESAAASPEGGGDAGGENVEWGRSFDQETVTALLSILDGISAQEAAGLLRSPPSREAGPLLFGGSVLNSPRDTTRVTERPEIILHVPPGTGLPCPRRWGCSHLRLLSFRTCSVGEKPRS